MNSGLANQLYKLYQDGVKICQDCRAGIARLMIVKPDSKDELPDILRDRESEVLAQPDAHHNSVTFTNNAELMKLYWSIQDKTERWLTLTRDLLTKLPQKSLLLRFNEPFNRNNIASVRQDYARYTYSKDIGAVMFQYDFLNDKLSRLLKIIEECEKTVTIGAAPQAQAKKLKVPKIAYKLAFNDMTGELTLNGRVIYKCKTYSKLNDALIEAFNSVNYEAKVSGNLASAIDAIRMPKALKRLMFRCGKGTFKIKPVLTAGDLKAAHLNQTEPEQEFRELSE